MAVALLNETLVKLLPELARLARVGNDNSILINWVTAATRCCPFMAF